MKHLRIMMIVMAVLLTAQMLPAQRTGWDFTLGGGVCGENVYPGSDVYYAVPVPNFKASYSYGYFNTSLSILEGFGLTYMNPGLGLIANMNINAGATRHSEEYSVLGISVEHNHKTRELLEGTPNLETNLAINMMLAYASPLGLFGVSLLHHPTTVEYNQPGLKDDTRYGNIYSALYMIEMPASERVSLSGFFNVSFMDRNFADTWFSVDRATASLNRFKAEAGLHSSMIAVELKYHITPKINLSMVGASTILLGDAKNSPFTVERVQRSMTIQTMYHF